MNTIAEIMQAGDIRTAVEAGRAPKRRYTVTPEKKIQKPKRARFKLQVYFKDGNCRYFYSLDFCKSPDSLKYHIDEFDGLKWLCDYINDNLQKIKTATIYANIERTPLTSSKKYNFKLFTVGLKHFKYYRTTETVCIEQDSFCKVIDLPQTEYEIREA